MAKVARRNINYQYSSLDPKMLIEGTVIPFDAYIKRFDDYVIIIEAGTLITKELHDKINLNKAIYTLKVDAQKIKEYKTINNIADETLPETPFNSIEAVERMEEALSQTISLEEHLHIVYTTVGGLMATIFQTGNEKLPLEALQTCCHQIEQHVNIDVNVMPLLLKIIQEEYCTGYHSTNVAFFSAILGKAIHLSQEDILDLTFAGLLHDIGKIRIDKTIQLKPDVLTAEEYEIMKRHCDEGVSILQNNGIGNQKILNAVRYHHEKLDRSGYPQRLYGKLIPKFARIIGMCDVFDALTTKRTYRRNYTSFEALLTIKRDMSAQFDEEYTDTFIRLLR